MIDRNIYQRARAQGTPAKHAFDMAKPPAHVLDWDTDRNGNPVVTFEHDGLTITATARPDEGIMIDDIGYGQFMASDTSQGYQFRPHPDAIRVHNGNERDGNSWYVPAEPLASYAKYASKQGASKSVARDIARANAEAQLQRVDPGQWGPDIRYLKVEASKAGVTLAWDTIGGIEVGWDDIFRDNGERYLTECLFDVLPGVVEEAKEAAPKIAASMAEVAAQVREVV